MTNQPNDEYPDPGYAWYVVVILTIAYVFSFLDRQILSLLVEPIKADLGISDTQMSLLQGLAFGIFYTLLGIPIGRLADRKKPPRNYRGRHHNLVPDDRCLWPGKKLRTAVHCQNRDWRRRSNPEPQCIFANQ